jgi:ABC-type spermidine/putrescine transport system permease subunit I
MLPRKYAVAGIFLVLLPFWTSSVIKSFAWMTLLGRNGPVNRALVEVGAISEPIRFLDNGIGMVVAMVYIMLPFAIMPIFNTLRTIDRTLLRAAAVLGANPFRQFLVVTLPLSLPGVAVGATIVFVVSLGFFVTPSLLGGSRVMMSILISDQANRLLNWPLASALAIVLLVFTAALFALLRLGQQLSAKALGGRAKGLV